jgi:RND superfamily putative drug exporter
VIGAATDYALLLAARFREEVAARADRAEAAKAAVRRSFGAITASAATVALGLLALLVSDLTNNRALGPVGAIGIVCAVLSTLTFLPAVLVLLGKAAYWPAKPRRVDNGTEGHGIWTRVASKVDRAPRRIWVTTTLVLAALAAFSPALSSKGVPLDEIFVNDAPSVTAQETLGRHFPAGSGNPAVIIADADQAATVTAAAEKTDGVASAGAVSRSGRPGGWATRSSSMAGCASTPRSRTPPTATPPSRPFSGCGTGSTPSRAPRRWWVVTRHSSTTPRRPRPATGH